MKTGIAAPQFQLQAFLDGFLRLKDSSVCGDFLKVHGGFPVFCFQDHQIRAKIAAHIPSVVHNGRLTSVSTLRVPASSANLGPGFDALGIALKVYLECKFSLSTRLSISVTGRDAHLIPPTEENLIWQTALSVAARAHQPLPPIQLAIDNDIPVGKGLGSSAAALIAGVVIAEKLLGLGWSPSRILDEAVRLEGHPDNVAACALGSVVCAAVEPAGLTRAIRLEMPEQFEIAVVVPNFALPTKEARAVLPDCYVPADVVFNVQRAALLIAAIATGDTSVFPTALDDRLHQPFRTHLVPGLAEILRLRRPGLLGCALSGAGPAVLVFYERGASSVCQLVRNIFAMNGCTTEVISSGVSRKGYEFI
jgi:homoserine kinase